MFESMIYIMYVDTSSADPFMNLRIYADLSGLQKWYIRKRKEQLI